MDSRPAAGGSTNFNPFSILLPLDLLRCVNQNSAFLLFAVSVHVFRTELTENLQSVLFGEFVTHSSRGRVVYEISEDK
jgi:hypothetical protein